MMRALKFACFALLALLLLWAPQAFAELKDSDHDFAGAKYTSTADPKPGMCTFCHTPHKAKDLAGNPATQLLWNHQPSANASWSWSDTTKTSNGTTLGPINNTWKGPTAKCLSCHDGSISIGAVYWFNETASPTVNISSVDPAVLSAGKIIEDSHVVGGSGDLKGNHPVAIPYPAAVGVAYNGITTNVPSALLGEWVSDPTANGIVLYYDGTSFQRVTTAFTAPDTSKLGIECSSCHDPHNNSAEVGLNDMFLRGSMSGNSTASDTAGYLCTKCHKK